jgi:hypothetical protein
MRGWPAVSTLAGKRSTANQAGGEKLTSFGIPHARSRVMFTLSLLFFLVALPAVVGLVCDRGVYSLGHFSPHGRLRAGAPIVYRVQETSNRPSPDAIQVYPSEHGESYDYLAYKYWRVEEVLEDGSIVALTPLHEHQYLRRNDPNLRKANLLERLRYAPRFPRLAYR